MPSYSKLTRMNVVLVITFFAILLGCGGDPEDPPPGSTEEKLCGTWKSEPIPLIQGGRANGPSTFEVYISNWNVGLIAWDLPNECMLRDGANAASNTTHSTASGFSVVGLTATSDPRKSGDGSTWVFRVDPDQPEVMYTSWILKDGTKRLDEAKFRKEKR